MVKCNINLRSVLYSTSLCKMPEVARLQALAASKIISDNIFILPFSIPTHLSEDLRILNSVKNLRAEEKYINEKNEIVQKNLPEAIHRMVIARNRYDAVSIWDEEWILDEIKLYEDYKKIVQNMQNLITETNNRKGEIAMEEEFYLAKLSDEYHSIQFKYPETEYSDIAYFSSLCSQEYNTDTMLSTLDRLCDGETSFN